MQISNENSSRCSQKHIEKAKIQSQKTYKTSTQPLISAIPTHQEMPLQSNGLTSQGLQPIKAFPSTLIPAAYIRALAQQIRQIVHNTELNFQRQFVELHESAAIPELQRLREQVMALREHRNSVIGDLAFIGVIGFDFCDDLESSLENVIASLNASEAEKLQQNFYIFKKKMKDHMREKQHDAELNEGQFMMQAEIYKKELAIQRKRADELAQSSEFLRKIFYKVLETWVSTENRENELRDCFERIQLLFKINSQQKFDSF